MENNLNNLYNNEQPTRYACITILLQGKQQNTTLSISHAQNRARSSFCHGEKGCHEMEQLHQDNLQETCPRRSVVHSCFPTSSLWSAWASKRRCPGEALFIVVKVVQVVFLYVYDCRQTKVRGEALLLVVKVVQVVFLDVLGISSQGKGKTICGFMGFPLAA